MTLTPQQQQLAVKYTNIAEGAAWQYSIRSQGRMSVEDARSAAMLGLVQALQTYDAYCARRGFDPAREDFQRAYLLKRIRGAILDDARSSDHMTRQDRQRVKALRQAEDDGAHGIVQAAAVTGIDPAVAWRVEADALPPVSLDDSLVTVDRGQIPDPGPGTESQHGAAEMLGAVLSAFDALPPASRALLALMYHTDLTAEAAARELGITAQRARKLHNEAVTAIHGALLTAVS